MFLLGADQRIKTNSWETNINRSAHFLRYLAGVAMFSPFNSHRIKRSRASEWSDQAIKDDFHRSRFLILVANASTGDVYVIAPWAASCHYHFCQYWVWYTWTVWIATQVTLNPMVDSRVHPHRRGETQSLPCQLEQHTQRRVHGHFRIRFIVQNSDS